MNSQPQLCAAHTRSFARLVALLCVGAMLLATGCSPRKNTARTWRGAGLLRPSLPGTTSVMSPPKLPPDVGVDPVPELRLALPPPPSTLAVRSEPARPHVPPPPAPENNVSRKPEPPVLAPQLTPAETTLARQQALLGLNVAEKNLARSQGKKLSGTQADLAAKVKGFIGDARSAGRDGDWTRARSLANKAQVLSEELAASL